MNSFFGRIKKLLWGNRHNTYLAQHGFYESFNDRKYRRSAGVHPFMPYSLADLLEHKTLANLNVLIATHRSSAIWFSHRNAKVTISRYWHSRRNTGIVQIDDLLNYTGDPADILIWDSPRMPACWEKLANFLSPQGVVIIVYENYYFAMDGGFSQLGDLLTARGMRNLEFHNPGPRREIMSAELYYPRDNVLDI